VHVANQSSGLLAWLGQLFFKTENTFRNNMTLSDEILAMAIHGIWMFLKDKRQ